MELRLHQIETGNEPQLDPNELRFPHVSDVGALLGGGLVSTALVLVPLVGPIWHCLKPLTATTRS
jgi:hypothetical protein